MNADEGAAKLRDGAVVLHNGEVGNCSPLITVERG
jgi:hypothetical protein